MKIFLGIIFLIICTVLGLIFSNKYSKKSKFYNAFISFHRTFINELNFTQKSILTLIKNLDCENDFNSSLKNYINTLEIDPNIDYLTSEEIDFLRNYFENLGLYDKTTQLNLFNGLTKKIESFYDLALSNEKKYKSLYIKVGFLIGLIGLIVII